MRILKTFSLSLLAVVLLVGSVMPAMAYKYTKPTNPLYKYTHPSNSYKYTTPVNSYKYTHPSGPYKYTRLTAPYKYTHPENPLYKYTPLGVLYDNTDNQQNDECMDTPFSDIKGHPAEEYIKELYCMGLLTGYSDGTFRPNNTISRAEILKLSMMASGLEPSESSHKENAYFTDISDWQVPWVNSAFELGIVDGYQSLDGFTYYYAPNNPVNRAEGVKILLATFGFQPGEITKSSFNDVFGWMIPWVEVAYGVGIVDMPESGRFYPTGSLTRADTAMYVCRLLRKSS